MKVIEMPKTITPVSKTAEKTDSNGPAAAPVKTLIR
jgi:hypothetical protein